MTDPLAGLREAINRGTVKVLCFPGDRPCPLKKGQVFKLRSCSIRIERVNRRLSKGTQEWRVGFERLSREDGFFLGTATVNETRTLQHGTFWGYLEEHGYSSSQDTLQAGACVPEPHQRRLSKEAAIRNERHRAQQRARAEKVSLERGLNDSRRRRAVKGHLERLDGVLEQAA